MEQVDLDGVVAEYELIGHGDPVLFVHARPFVSWFGPLCAVLDGWSLLRVRRTAPTGRDHGVEDDAVLCARLVDRLGLDAPHVVGHSYGGLVALDMARRRDLPPRSIALLEPATSGLLSPEEATAGMAPLLALADAEGPEAALTRFLTMVLGDDGAAALDRAVPGAMDEAVAHAAGFLAVELPAVARWSFTADDAAAVTCPVLNVWGSESAPRFHTGAEILRTWFPGAATFELAGATHLLMAQDPDAVAARLERFWGRT